MVSQEVISSLTVTGPSERVAQKIATNIARPHGADVDRDARFPLEAVDAMRSSGLLSAIIPEALGGGGADLADVAGAVRLLARECPSSALVYAMHSIEAFNLSRHATTPTLVDFVRRCASESLLLANANSEVGVGGDVSRSICYLEGQGPTWHLEKDALAISYAEEADALLTMTRRSVEATDTDMVYAVMEKADYSLTPASQWDTLGLRGTCSRGYHISAKIHDAMLFPVPFSVVANDGAGQIRQLLLSAVWVGIGESAVAVAHSFVRAAARKSIGVVPPGALRVAEMVGELQASRSLLETAAQRLSALAPAGSLENGPLTITLRNLKVSTSQLAAGLATQALEVCGIMGYKRDSPFSLDRIIRDAHGGLVMVSNDRYLHDNARFLLVTKEV